MKPPPFLRMTITDLKTVYPDDPKWPFVAGFTNCEESKEPVECEVTGTIPAWLRGVLYRGGPGYYSMLSDVLVRIVNNYWV